MTVKSISFNVKRFLTKGAAEDMESYLRKNVSNPIPDTPPDPSWLTPEGRDTFTTAVWNIALEYAQQQGLDDDQAVTFANEYNIQMLTGGTSPRNIPSQQTQPPDGLGQTTAPPIVEPELDIPTEDQYEAPGLQRKSKEDEIAVKKQIQEQVLDLGDNFSGDPTETSMLYSSMYNDRIERLKDKAVRTKLISHTRNKDEIAYNAAKWAVDYSLGLPQKRQSGVTKEKTGQQNMDMRMNFFLKNPKYLLDEPEIIQGLSNVPGFPQENFPVAGLEMASGRKGGVPYTKMLTEYLSQFADSHLIPKLDNLIRNDNEDVHKWITNNIYRGALRAYKDMGFRMRMFGKSFEHSDDEGNSYEPDVSKYLTISEMDAADRLKGKMYGRSEEEQKALTEDVAKGIAKKVYNEIIPDLNDMTERVVDTVQSWGWELISQNQDSNGLKFLTDSELFSLYYSTIQNGLEKLMSSTPKHDPKTDDFVFQLLRNPDINAYSAGNNLGSFRVGIKDSQDILNGTWTPNLRKAVSGESLTDAFQRYGDMKRTIKTIHPKTEPIPKTAADHERMNSIANEIKAKGGQMLANIDNDLIKLTFMQDDDYIKRFQGKEFTNSRGKKEKGFTPFNIGNMFAHKTSFMSAASQIAMDYELPTVRTFLDMMAPHKKLQTGEGFGMDYDIRTNMYKTMLYYSLHDKPVPSSVVENLFDKIKINNKAILDSVGKVPEKGEKKKSSKLTPFPTKFLEQVVGHNRFHMKPISEDLINEIFQYNTSLGELGEISQSSKVAFDAQSMMVWAMFEKTMIKLSKLGIIKRNLKEIKTASTTDHIDSMLEKTSSSFIRFLRKFGSGR